MEEFHSYSPEDVIAANLLELDRRAESLSEQSLAHLYELAEAIVTGKGQDSEFIASLPDHRPLRAPANTEILLQNAASVRCLQALADTWKRVVLCQRINLLAQSRQKLSIESFFPDIEHLQDSARDRIVYQRNSYADTAYLRFASLLSSPRAIYSHNFETVCEEVYNQNCEYGILPLENSTEGPLTGFARLIARYELKIAATCDVPTADDSRVTRFALLRRNPIPWKSATDKNVFFAFSLLEGEPDSADILYAARCCGLTLHRMGAHAIGKNDDIVTHYVFRTENSDLLSFLLYLGMEAPHYELQGLYPQLPEK